MTAHDRARTGRDLRNYSPITWTLERLFWGMHQLSPSRLFSGSRIALVSSEAFRRDPKAATVLRSRQVEAYLLVWILVELGLLVFVGAVPPATSWIVSLLVSLRILDILQAAVNLSVFDQLRTSERLVISSAVRTLVLSMVNYLELIVCFAILYLSLRGQLAGAAHWTDALYFSVVTQLTIGFGDIRPVGYAKGVAVVQALIAFAFTVLLLGRIVSVLPRIESVMKHRPDD